MDDDVSGVMDDGVMNASADERTINIMEKRERMRAIFALYLERKTREVVELLLLRIFAMDSMLLLMVNGEW